MEPAGEAEDDDGWQMTPMRYSGNLSHTRNQLKTDDGASTSYNSNTLLLQGNSFFMAPYIAQISGNLALSEGGLDATGPQGDHARSDNRSLAYGLQANIFPLSRFPLVASLSQAFASSSVPGGSSDSSMTQFGLRQQYQSEDGRERYTGVYNRAQFSGKGFDSATDVLQGAYSTARAFDDGDWFDGDHSLTANVGYNGVNGAIFGLDSRQINVNANHAWRVHEDLSLYNQASFAQYRANTVQGNSVAVADSHVLLASSSFNWKPYEDLPLLLNGSGNVIVTGTDSEGGRTSQQTLSGFLTGLYRMDDNLSFAGSLLLQAVNADGKNQTLTTQALTATYTGTPLTFAGFVYGWGAGATASYVTNSLEGGFLGTGVSLNHNLLRTLDLSGYGYLNFSIGQSVARATIQSGDTQSVANNLGVGWSVALAERLNGALSFQASQGVGRDSSGESRFSSASFQGNLNYQITGRANLALNAMVNRIQIEADNAKPEIVDGRLIDPSEPQTTGTFAIIYTHRNPFAIANLNYSANLLWVGAQTNQRFVGVGAGGFTPGQTADPNQFNAQNQRSSSFQQMLDYRIGRLAFRLNYALIEQSGKKSASLFGSISRDFDGFFDGRF